MDEQQKMFMAFLERKQQEDENFQVDFDDILNYLESDLPMIPGVPIVTQVNPNPYQTKEHPIRVTFGKLMPKDKKDKKDKKKKAPKKQAGKKDEKPKPPTKWAGPPVPPPATTLDLMRECQNELQRDYPMSLKQDSCNTGVMPTIIKEVFMPPDAPSTVATLMESALVYQNSANYEMAVHSLEQARDEWRALISPPQKEVAKDAASALSKTITYLRPEQELYFELSLGSIYESCGKDDIAISCYMKALRIKLAVNHPD